MLESNTNTSINNVSFVQTSNYEQHSLDCALMRPWWGIIPPQCTCGGNLNWRRWMISPYNDNYFADWHIYNTSSESKEKVKKFCPECGKKLKKKKKAKNNA